MSQIEIIDREGWRRLFEVNKGLILVGSQPQNDIVLDGGRGGGVQPRHLQLVAVAGGYRLVNLGDNELILSNGERLPAHAVCNLTDGSLLQLGEFKLKFHVGNAPEELPMLSTGASEPTTQNVFNATPRLQEGFSTVIGLSIRLPYTQLSPEQPIEGSLTVRNLGEKTGAQFRLELDGLPQETYDIGAGPILFPGAQKEVRLQLKHPRASFPPVGPHRITVRASAPLAYPGESAAATQIIEILPYHAHRVHIVTQTK